MNNLNIIDMLESCRKNRFENIELFSHEAAPMQINKEIDYGFRAMIILASNEGSISSREIAKRFRIPSNFLSLILSKLVRSKLIRSTQGPKGGYNLAKSADSISLLEIIKALQGEVCLNSCNIKDKCTLSELCSMTKVWKNLKIIVDRYFAEIKLSDLLMEEETQVKIRNSLNHHQC